jgi:hypothetical protein
MNNTTKMTANNPFVPAVENTAAFIVVSYFQFNELNLLKVRSKLIDGKHDNEFYSVHGAKYALLPT